MRIILVLLFGVLPSTSAFIIKPNTRPSGIRMALDADVVTSPYELMSKKELKDLVKQQNPERGIWDSIKIRRKTRKELLVDLRSDGKVEWSTQKGAATFGLSLDQSPPKIASPEKSFSQMANIFPEALTNAELVSMVNLALEEAGYDKKKTLLSTSLCCDEVNRPLETALSNEYDTNFNMGGLAGFPFGGATSFGAMAAHIPDGGSCLIVYGPHVGIDSTGATGTVERRGRANGGACCGSAVAASGYVASVLSGEAEEAGMPDIVDAQQYFVGKMLMPYAKQLDGAKDKMVELPKALYDAQTNLMKRIVTQSSSAVADGTIAVLGGIQINTPPGFTDYYLPMSFDLYDNKGELIKELGRYHVSSQ